MTTSLHEVFSHAERHRSRLAHELGLGSTDVTALWEIVLHPGRRPGDLARALGLGVAGTSSVVDKLAKAGFVRREPHPTDRRSLILVATPAGRHAQAWMADGVDRVIGDALGDDVDVAAAAGLLRRIAASFAAAGS